MGDKNVMKTATCFGQIFDFVKFCVKAKLRLLMVPRYNIESMFCGCELVTNSLWFCTECTLPILLKMLIFVVHTLALQVTGFCFGFTR